MGAVGGLILGMLNGLHNFGGVYSGWAGSCTGGVFTGFYGIYVWNSHYPPLQILPTSASNSYV